MYRLSRLGVTRIADGAPVRRTDPGWVDYLAWLLPVASRRPWR
jgi:hypothetical protein